MPPGLARVSVPAWIERLPKAELHLHLEGSATAETLVALAQAAGRRDLSLDAVRRKIAYRNFLGFLLAFKYVSEQLRAPSDYAFLLHALLAELHRQRVLYAEITFAAGVALFKRQDVDRIFEALLKAAEEARREYPVEVRWIFDAVRNFGADHVERVAEYALRWQDAGVVAFGIGGDEAAGPAGWFRTTFDRVRAAGLRVTVHAGETVGPESIWAAIRDLGAERIGHGLSAFRDPELLDYLAQERTALEVCPTSNVRTGALAQHTGSDDLCAHPLMDYCRRGLTVTLNSDDPGLFDTTLNEEYARGHELGLSREALIGVAANAFHCAFCEPAVKETLLERFQSEALTLREGS